MNSIVRSGPWPERTTLEANPMRRTLSAVLSVLLAGAIAAAPASRQQAAPTHEAELAIGDEVVVSGGPGVGTNAQYFDNYECDSDPDSYCETVLVKLTNPYEEENAKKGRERATLQLDLVPTTYPAELDMGLFESDPDGNQGAQISQAGTIAIVDCETGCESITAVITSTPETTEHWVLVHVVYFAAAGEYGLAISFTQ